MCVTSNCPDQQFCDPITSTCIDCYYACDSEVGNKADCARYCPDYMSISTRHTTSPVPDHNQQISFPVLPAVCVLLGVIVVVVISFILFMIRRQKKALSDDQTPLHSPKPQPGSCCIWFYNQSNHCTTTTVNTSPGRRNDPITDDEKLGVVTCGDKLPIEEEDISRLKHAKYHTDSSHMYDVEALRAIYSHSDGNIPSKRAPSTKSDSKNSSSSEYTTAKSHTGMISGLAYPDRSGAHISVENARDKKIPCPNQANLNQSETKSSLRPRMSDDCAADVVRYDGSSRSASLTAPARETSSTPPSKQPNPHNSLLRAPVRSTLSTGHQMSLSLSFDLGLRSDIPFDHQSELQSTPLSKHSSSRSENHWSTVMKVYDQVDQNLHNLPWIAGCIISNNALKVVANNQSNQSPTELRDKLKNYLDRDIDSDRYDLTFEGPDLEPTCGRFGAGSVLQIHTKNSGIRTCNVTLFGRAQSSNFGQRMVHKTVAFTVGHGIRDGQSSGIYCRCGPNKELETAKCIESISIVYDTILRNIKHRVYDMAVFELDQSTQITNSYKYKAHGMETTLNIEVNKTSLTTKNLIPGTPVLMIGPNNNIIEAVVDEEMPYITSVMRNPHHQPVQVMNMIQLRHKQTGQALVEAGDSGSLITRHPRTHGTPSADGSVTVEAFAFIAGSNPDKPQKAWALPLWEQIQTVLSKDHLKNFIGSLRFGDYLVEDSGIGVSLRSDHHVNV